MKHPKSYYKRNPQGTRVAKCVRKVRRKGKVKSPIAVCQKATKQSYKTGRRLKPKRNAKGRFVKTNPARHYYVLAYRGSDRKRPFFLTGTSLDTDKAKARPYKTSAAAHAVVRNLARQFPRYTWGVMHP